MKPSLLGVVLKASLLNARVFFRSVEPVGLYVPFLPLLFFFSGWLHHEYEHPM